jgi:hypothetical protein
MYLILIGMEVLEMTLSQAFEYLLIYALMLPFVVLLWWGTIVVCIAMWRNK